jgi:uncharacterized alkaline shock family protein YloU
MTDGTALISSGILRNYAADAALEVDGVRELVGRKSIRVELDHGQVRVELHLQVDWGAPIPEVGRTVQTRVREYLVRMAALEARAVDVVIDEIGPAA